MEWLDGNIGAHLTIDYPSVMFIGPGAHGSKSASELGMKTDRNPGDRSEESGQLRGIEVVDAIARFLHSNV
jgi:hypothetical protein